MARRARSLDVLVAEVNALVPNRDKDLDGWLGDPAHQARPSRHNPNDAGVVCAQDITHDPAGGCDIHAIARDVVTHPPTDLEYVISAGQVAKRRTGWTWEDYTGPSPHTGHAHFAVGRGPDAEPTPPYDDTDPWGIYPPADPGDDDMPLRSFLAKSTERGAVYLVRGDYSQRHYVSDVVADLIYRDGQAAPENRFLQDHTVHEFGQVFLDTIPDLSGGIVSVETIVAAVHEDMTNSVDGTLLLWAHGPTSEQGLKTREYIEDVGNALKNGGDIPHRP